MIFKAVVGLLVFNCLLGFAAEIKGQVGSFGIFKFAGKEEIVATPETTSRKTRVQNAVPILIVATNQIPARLGLRFGFFYRIDNIPAPDGEIKVLKVVKHPSIRKQDGTLSKGFETVEEAWVKSGQAFGWTGYGFDDEYELAPGEWEFEIRFNGKRACKQKFTVVQDSRRSE